MSTNVVVKGYGPHVRLSATAVGGKPAVVRVATKRGIRKVPVSQKGTNLTFHRAA